jgi:pimeloyl-ACP methyl ester carboxylesterase
MPSIETNGIHIAYQDQGDGQALVLIAGVGYGSWFWHKITPGLAERYRVITFDNRGAGGSDKPEGPYSVPLMAADTIGLMEALALKEASLLGHSLGGFIAQEVAVARPDLVGRLVLASTNHGGSNVVPMTPEALEVLTNREGDPVELVKRGIQVSTAPGFAQEHPRVVKELMDYRFTSPVPPPQYQAQVFAGAGMASLTEEQIEKRMAAIQAPTLILFGEHDNVVPPGNADLMAQKMPRARVEIIPGAGHIFPIEKPEETMAVVAAFLGGDS